MIEGAIFDLDGTLLDSMSVWDTAGEDYLRLLGIDPKENLRAVLDPMSLWDAACYLRDAYDIPLTEEEITEGIHRLVARFYREEAPLKAGAKPFLKRLLDSGVKMCVATATDRSLAEAALRRCGVLPCFLEILTCSRVGCGKASPRIYREALRCLQTDKGKTVVFEDALHAIRTAKADDFPTVGIFDAHETHPIQNLTDCYLSDYRETGEFWKFAESL